MNPDIKPGFILKLLLIANIISTAIHFTDNYRFIHLYPQPAWITAPSIYQSWAILTIVGIIGSGFYQFRKFWLAYACLSIYALTGLASPAHYLYGPLSQFSVKMHLLIWTDGVTGLAMGAFVFWSACILKEWQESKVTS